jgi:hypothetical protein
MTFLSKGFGAFAAIEWGLRDLKFLSPQTFSGRKGSREMTFTVHAENYDSDFSVSVPYFETDFLLLFIPNKEGDNCVVLTRADTWEKRGLKVDMTWISKKLKRKWNANLKAPDILPNA